MTVDGKGATKSEQILAQRLACGCVVGGEEYNQFLAARETLMAAAYKEKAAIDEVVAGKVAAIWKQILAAKAGV
jgi:hypothetical protein